MTKKFISTSNPSKELLAKLTALSPTNPFYTRQYNEAQHSLGFTAWFFFECDDGQIKSGCTAFMKTGRLNRSLTIASLPTLYHPSIFWANLIKFCKRNRVTKLNVNTFASSLSHIPSIGGEIQRRQRTEFLLELQKHDLWGNLSKNHARNIKRGSKAGLRIRRTHEKDACLSHAKLIAASMARRADRGEQVKEELPLNILQAYTESGAAELFQAVSGRNVLSSVLVLQSKKGAYYHSAGNNPEGMALGASHFLIREIADILKSHTFQVFNLGGSDHTNPGLIRFKAGFGAVAVDLEEAGFFLGSRARLKLIDTYHLLRRKYKHLIKGRQDLQALKVKKMLADKFDKRLE